ncbi:MAG: NfeD family protein [Isosphaeraceae bacterium]
MHPRRDSRSVRPLGLLLSACLLIGVPTHRAAAQPTAAAPEVPANLPGQIFTITEPITSETVAQLRNSTRQVIERAAAFGQEPLILFEIRPGQTAAGTTDFGAAFDLATIISTRMAGARLTVAYVPEPLTGFAVLPVLACDEIVMGSSASIGPITPAGATVDPAHRDPVRVLALRKGRDPQLLLGLLDPEIDLRVVRTGDQQIHYVAADSLETFRTSHQVVEEGSAWEGAGRGVLPATRARERGFSRLTVDSEAELRAAYRLGGQSMANDPTIGREIRPVWIQISGPVDSVKRAYLTRRIDQARREGVNLVFFQINSQGGMDTAADGMADTIADIKDMKTVAYLDDRALGVSALIALACNDIVFRNGATLGDVRQVLTGHDGRPMPLDERQIQSLAGRAANLAELKGHAPAVARALVDPAAVLVQAKDTRLKNLALVLQSDVDADPARFQEVVVRKDKGQVLTIGSDTAESFGMGRAVSDEEALKGLYGLRGKTIRVDGPTWVDSLVSVLTDPFVSWLLLFVGLFMLVLELKLPGIGLPAITSALAFVLFFWSHYLSGTADQLEIILFLVGMVCLALEVFVFPGFGVFGMSGVLLVLTSIVMASHTFVWPTQEYEYREMGQTLLQVMVAMVAVAGGAAVLGRYFPSLPLLNRLVLKAEPWMPEDAELAAKPSLDDYMSLAYLIGETGRTTTVLRPMGKARFGSLLIDVTADGFFIEPDSLVEVVDVRGSRVIVKRAEV